MDTAINEINELEALEKEVDELEGLIEQLKKAMITRGDLRNGS